MENAFLAASQDDGWIGGTDQITEGVLVWADGPEDFLGEDAAHLCGGTWNDLPLTAGAGGYFVEFNASIATGQVPEPSTYLLFGTGLLGVLTATLRSGRQVA